MASNSKVLIIGATGCIGKFIVEASVKSGHQTFALVREETFSKVHTQEYFKSHDVEVLIRFLPSEFGMDVDRVHAVDPAQSLIEAKSQIRRVIEEENIPYTFICSYYFARTSIQNLFQPELEAPPRDRVHILGDGTSK
uniref:NmrA-like domain-containing protein n=1 Tax=Chenopodium quinoa TaxID=63459 RepID=A0A803MLC6_CHEQI